MDSYVAPRLAEFIHSIPHFNFALRQVPANFNTSNTAYVETLVTLGSLPALFLVLILLLLLFYMFTRCCCTNHKYKHTFIGLKWSMGCAATLTCVVLAAGFYGNETVHNGVTGLEQSTSSIAKTVDSIRNMTRNTETVLIQDISARLENLRQLFMSESRPANTSIVRWLDNEMTWMGMNVSEEVAVLRHLNADTRHVNADALSSYVRLSETIRWPAMIILLSLMTLFCIMLLIAVVRHSRWLLVFFSVASLVSLILCFSLASIHVFVTVGVADFCVWPDNTVRRAVTSQFNDPQLADTVATYYLNCSSHDNQPASPWQQQLTVAQLHSEFLLKRLEDVNNVALKYYPSSLLEPAILNLRDKLMSCRSVYTTLSEAVTCTHIHHLYNMALRSLCDTTLLGLTVLVISLLICGLSFIILTWCDAHAWIHIQKRRDYLRVDTMDPYGTTCRRPPSLSTLTAGGGVSSTLTLPAGRTVRCSSPHGSLMASGNAPAGYMSRNRNTPPSLRSHANRQFPTANHGSLRPFVNRTSEYRTGTLPTRYSPITAASAPSAPDPPPYTTALLNSASTADYSDYDNYN